MKLQNNPPKLLKELNSKVVDLEPDNETSNSSTVQMRGKRVLGATKTEVLLEVGLVLTSIGWTLMMEGMYNTSGWTETADNRFGPWSVCDEDATDCASWTDTTTTVEMDAIRSVQAMTILATVFGVGAIPLLVLIINGLLEHNYTFMSTAISFGFTLIAVTVWGTVVYPEIEASSTDAEIAIPYITTTIGAGLVIIGGSLTTAWKIY